MTLKGEPALTTGIIVGLIGAIIAVGTAFGLNFSTDQVAAILGLTTVLSPFITALHIRGYVTPVSKTVDPTTTTSLPPGTQITLPPTKVST